MTKEHEALMSEQKERLLFAEAMRTDPEKVLALISQIKREAANA